MMATEPLNPKRKRGRPSNASKQVADALEANNAVADEYDADADLEARPKKRGRPRKSVDPAVEHEPGEDAEPKPKRRRGRPSLKDTLPIVDNGAVEPQKTKRKRGRPSLKSLEMEARAAADARSSPRRREETGTVEEQRREDAEAEATSEIQPPKSRGRKPTNSNRGIQEDQDEEGEDPAPAPSRLKPVQPTKQAGRGSTEKTEKPPKRPRGRPSLRDMTLSEVQNKAPEPSRVPRANAEKPAAQDNHQLREGSRHRGRQAVGTKASSNTATHNEPRSSLGNQEPNSQSEQPAEATEPKKKRQRASQNTNPDDDDELPPSPEKPYPHIAPHTRRVRQSTIEAKWSPLAEPSLSAASSILHLAHRPILQRLSNTQQRRTHTSAALRLVTHRITRKMAKGIPFPPATILPGITGRLKKSGAGGNSDDGRVAELDFESVLDAKQALERQLDPVLHAVELLTQEKEKLENELERDYEALRNLESGAKAQAREHRTLLKKAHGLAPTPGNMNSPRRKSEDRDITFSNINKPFPGGLFSDFQPKEQDLKLFALQLSSHAESLKNNLRQTNDIIPQLVRSRSSLKAVLFEHLGLQQYEHIVLG